MGETTLVSGFSWKRGFLGHQQQHKSHCPAPIYKATKEQEKVASPDAPLDLYTNQWKKATSTPAAPSTTTPITINPAPVPPIFSQGELPNMTDSHSNYANEAISTPAPHKSMATTPRVTLVHDDGHFHQASPL